MKPKSKSNSFVKPEINKECQRNRAFTATPKGHDDDYVDKNGQHWRFLAHADNKTNLTALLKANWLMNRHRCVKLNDYVCRRQIIRERFGGKRCHFKAVFLKANSRLYTRGEHNHPLREGETPKGTEDYFDIFGKNWPHFARIKDRAHLNEILEENCLKICTRTQSTIKVTCPYYTRDSGGCKVRATFLRSNSTLYLRGEHNNHELVLKRRGRKNSLLKGKQRNESSLEKDEEEGEEQIEVDDFEEDEDKRNYPENNEQSAENPVAIEPLPELEVQIVEEVNRQEYKMLPLMKRELNADNAGRPKQWPAVTIESEVLGWQWQQTRSQKEGMLRPVKKEEPVEADEQQQQPTTSNARNLKAIPEPALYCYYTDDAGVADMEYEKCDSTCIRAYFNHVGYPNKFYQGCGKCEEEGKTMPKMMNCHACDMHFCNEDKKQTLEQILKEMDLWEPVRDDVILRYMLEQHLGMVRLMHKRAMGDVLRNLLKKSRLSIGKLFGMRAAMDILVEKPTVFGKLADHPEKLRYLVWNRAEFMGKLNGLYKFDKWLDGN